jgi:hypothetical protein
MQAGRKMNEQEVRVHSHFNAPPHLETRHGSVPGVIHSIATSLLFLLLLRLICLLVPMQRRRRDKNAKIALPVVLRRRRWTGTRLSNEGSST